MEAMTFSVTSSANTSVPAMLICHDDLPYQDSPSTAPASAPSSSVSRVNSPTSAA